MREARPFPYESLPRIARSDADLVRRCARTLPLGALRAVASSATEWLGAPLDIEALPIERPQKRAPRDLGAPICAAILEPLDHLETGRVAIELEPRFASVIVDRVLGGTGDELPPDPGVLGEIERGVLAYVIARALAVAAAGTLRLAAIVTSPAALELALGRAPLACWPARARLGAEVGIVRAWIPDTALARAPAASTPGPHAASLERIGATVVLEGGRASLEASELATLAAGDVIVLDDAPARPSAGSLQGEAVARLRRGATEWRCAIDGERFVVRAIEAGRPAARGRAREATMASDVRDEERAAQLLRVAGDAPVELVVEIARFEMPLSELAALRPGEVLATGRAIGERVVLRAGDRTVAHGELVEIEGEIGLRVISLG